MDRDNVLYISNNKYVVIFNNLSHLKKESVYLCKYYEHCFKGKEYPQSKLHYLECIEILVPGEIYKHSFENE